MVELWADHELRGDMEALFIHQLQYYMSRPAAVYNFFISVAG